MNPCQLIQPLPGVDLTITYSQPMSNNGTLVAVVALIIVGWCFWCFCKYASSELK